MKKIALMSSCFFVIWSCTSQRIIQYTEKKEFKETQSPIFIQKEKIVKTASEELHYPFMHINGFKDYEFTKGIVTLTEKVPLRVYELRFNATYSSFYTRKVMFDNFGNWNEGLFLRGNRFPLLIWKNLKLLKNSNELFTVIASGFEDTKGKLLKSESTKKSHGIYASVMVLDSEGNDYLAGNRKHKKDIIDFFSNGIKNLDNSLLFYSKFHHWTQHH